MGRVRLVVEKDPSGVAVHADAYVLQCLAQARAKNGRASLALSGGSTPEAMYRRWGQGTNADTWRGVEIFFGDERAVGPDHASSNHRMATQAWLGHGQVEAARVHRMVGEAADLDAEARRYAKVLDDTLGTSGVDVLLLGMGNDAHTASLFPGTPALDATGRVTALHAGAPEFKRLTFTPAEIARAAHVVVLVTGAAKAPVLQQVLEGPEDVRRMPIQLALRRHPSVVLVCDEAAAAGASSLARGG